MGKADRHSVGLGRFTVRELVLAAAMASVGGAMSAYVGYLGNLINRFLGVPFGAGQILAGLHVIWPLLAAGLTGRAGAGTLTGVAKGMVEFLMGGTHGVVIVLVSGVQGVLVDLGLSLNPRPALWTYVVAGTAAAASNVFVFQALYFSGVPAAYILFMAGLAAVSGASLGGWLAYDLLGSLSRAGLSRSPVARPGRARTWAALGTALVLVAGGGYYYLDVWEPFGDGASARVGGAVASTMTFQYEEWAGEEVTVMAELAGAVTYEPERPYTGVPVSRVLGAAEPLAEGSELLVRGRDGYEVSFPLAELLEDSEVILVREGNRLRLVAGGHSGTLWVRDVVALEVR
ncbi:MAG: ECF transporter S component [Candidatus Bipolaricaulota bacterium]